MRMLDCVNFKYCPRCGEPHLRSNDAQSFVCLSCGFTYYHSSAAVAVGIIKCDDKIILTKRAREPQKGLLALPGGFVDYRESLESALVRELQEELNLTVTTPNYLCSHWERYLFRDVVYFSTIAFYVVSANDISNAKANDDIDAFLLVQPNDIDYSKLAFESDRVALDRYRRLSLKGEIRDATVCPWARGIMSPQLPLLASYVTPETEGIKYAGSKLKLLPYILRLVREVNPRTIALT